MNTNSQLADEIRQYMQSYGCDYAKAKLDVMDAYGETLTETDAFYEWEEV